MRALLIATILFISLACGIWLVFTDWQSLPAEPQHFSSALDSIIESRQKTAIDDAVRALTAGQGSMLSKDDTIIHLPNMSTPVAQELQHHFVASLTVEQQLANIPSVSERIKQIVAGDDALLIKALGEADQTDFLKNNPDREVADQTTQALSGLGGSPNDREIEEMTIRRGLIMALTNQVKQLFSAGQYDACIALCEQSINSLQDSSMQSAINILRKFHFRAREGKSWEHIQTILLTARHSVFPPQDVVLLKQYINDFSQEIYPEYLSLYKDRLTHAQRLLAWNNLVHAHDLNAVINRKPDIANVGEMANVKPRILAIHDFYKRYATSTEGHKAKEVATTLLKQHFEKALEPRDPDERKVRFTLMRSKNNYEGIIESHDLEQYITIIAPQNTPRKSNRSYFFSSALERPPTPVNDPAAEAHYRRTHRTDVDTLATFNWNPSSLTLLNHDELQSFPGIQTLRPMRFDHVARIRQLITMCESFQDLDDPENEIDK